MTRPPSPPASPVPLVFTDLDDTLFQTARKMAGAPDPALRATEATNGHHSYMTRRQDALVGWLLSTTQAIPVTARSTEAMARCRLPFADHRVCANGAVILLPDGTPDRAWAARIDAACVAAAGTLEALLAEAGRLDAGAGRFRFWLVHEGGRAVYFCLKSNGEEAWIDAVEEPLRALAGEGFVPHRNGNNLSLTPSGISKRAAVAHLVARLDPAGSRPVLGLGDSLTDLPFLELCDLMALPAASQIASRIASRLSPGTAS